MKTREDILNIIEEEDVEFIRLQFTDMWGNLKNIAITANQFMRVNDSKFYFEGSAFFDGLSMPNEDLYLVPDFDTFVILPWRPQQGRVGKMICDICKEDGSLFELSPRKILKNVVEEVSKKGYEIEINPECEFFLFHTDENGNPTTLSHEKAGNMDVGPIDFGENARRDIVLALEDMGFEVQSSYHEKAPAQHEIDFSEADPLKTADSLMTFRFATRSIAKRFGLYATFMPKPFQNVMGSGLHLNFKIYKDGKNLFNLNNNEIAKYFIGGIMEHSKGVVSLTNPIINSYKRILSTPNGTEIKWDGIGDYSTIKLMHKYDDASVNLRFPDSASNPYLAIAVSIIAGIEGIEKKLDPNSLTASKKAYFPDNLEDAITGLKGDELIKKVLGCEFVATYSDEKIKEWKEYITQVSNWEINKYLVKM